MALSEQLRAQLKAPFGEVCNTHEMLKAAKAAPGLLISVGDRCTYDLLTAGVHPHICVFDFRCMREPIGKQMQAYLEEKREILHVVKNPAGEITEGLVHAVKGCLSKEEGTILIEGEDDLAALVLLSLAPLGSLLIYGQPNEGAAVVKIGESTRKKALSMLAQF